MTGIINQRSFGGDFWERICSLHEMPKLNDLGAEPRFLFNNFYQVGPCAYVHASHQWNFAFTEEALYVLNAIWAPSFAAFCRRPQYPRIGRFIAKDDGASAILPAALRLEPNGTTFSTICKQAFAKPELRPFEMDLQGWGNETGPPTGHVVSAKPFSYLFSIGCSCAARRVAICCQM